MGGGQEGRGRPVRVGLFLPLDEAEHGGVVRVDTRESAAHGHDAPDARSEGRG